jgi:hypothetical protein
MSDDCSSDESRIRQVFIGASRKLFCRDFTGQDCDRIMESEAENCGIESHVRIVPPGALTGDASFRTRSSFHQRKLIVDEDYDLIFDESRDAIDFDKSTFSSKELWVATKVQREFTSYHKCEAAEAISNIRLLIEKSVQEGKYQKLSWGGHLFTWSGYLAIVTSDLQTVVRYRTRHNERTPQQVVDGVRSRLSKKRKGLRLKGLIPDSITPGVIVDGIITNIVDYGVFVQIANDFEALLHRSELVHLPEVDGRPLEFGESLQVEALSVDRVLNRVTLRLIKRSEQSNKSS